MSRQYSPSAIVPLDTAPSAISSEPPKLEPVALAPLAIAPSCTSTMIPIRM
jgi:hypothetical protein